MTDAEDDGLDGWPDLPYEAWKETATTLHLWTQIVGKARLVLTPWLNHSWHVALYVTGRGLTTSPIPHGTRTFEVEFDFIDHALRLAASDGGRAEVELRPRSVADFRAAFLAALAEIGVTGVRIFDMPSEIADAIPFSKDHVHAAYDPRYAARFSRVLGQVDRVFKLFRSGFLGKASPVHFFWGSFDLAVTRFSGRLAPAPPGGVPNLPDLVAREAYSHEVSSAGFWPGGGGIDYPAFYSYAYPAPDGFAASKVEPDAAFFHDILREFVLPYEAVRTAEDPDAVLLAFLQTTYAAAADTGGWDRAALECAFGEAGVPRVM